jgi:surface polysaccharide O-acyltransferase-like enzyme
MALGGLALLSSATSFAALLFAPDASWLSIGILAQFQPTKAPTYALFFGFGTLAASRSWLRGSALLSRPLFWTALSAVLAVAYLVAGRSVFPRLDDSQLLPPLALLAFATARGLLSVASLGLLLSFSIKGFDRPMAADQRLSALSFEIYLVHFFLVILFQGILSGMEAVPAPAKAAIVFFAALPSSYLLAGAVKRCPRAFAIGAFALFALAALALR